MRLSPQFESIDFKVMPEQIWRLQKSLDGSLSEQEIFAFKEVSRKLIQLLVAVDRSLALADFLYSFDQLQKQVSASLRLIRDLTVRQELVTIFKQPTSQISFALHLVLVELSEQLINEDAVRSTASQVCKTPRRLYRARCPNDAQFEIQSHR